MESRLPNPTPRLDLSGLCIGTFGIWAAAVVAWSVGEGLFIWGAGGSVDYLGIVLIYAAFLGAIPAAAAGIAMWTWRRASATPPLVIAALFVAILDLFWLTAIVVDQQVGPASHPRVYIVAALAAGVLGAAVANAFTHRVGASLVAGAAAAIIMYVPGPWFEIYTIGAESALRFAVLMSASAFAAAAAYTWLEGLVKDSTPTTGDVPA